MKVVIIGAGNVGTHFARALKSVDVEVLQIVSRTMKSAVELASEIGCAFATDIQDVNKNADVYFLCVSDSAIVPVLRQLKVGEKMIVHMSGTVGMSVFYDYALNYGCVYPLQTFSKFKDLNYSEIPFFIEANSDENQNMLMDLLKLISPQIYTLSSQQRSILHLCAIMVNNFSNHLCTLAEMLMKENQLQFDVLKPLLRETTDKIMKYSPYVSQTGPAVRGDTFIMEKHRDILKNHKEILDIYNAISDSIVKTHSEDK